MGRNLEVFGEWTPAAPPQLMPTRLDGQSGFGVPETDDPAAPARNVAIFAPYLQFTVHPVIELELAVPVVGQAIALSASVYPTNFRDQPDFP